MAPSSGRRLATQLMIALGGILIVAFLLGSFAQSAEITEAPDFGAHTLKGWPVSPSRSTRYWQVMTRVTRLSHCCSTVSPEPTRKVK